MNNVYSFILGHSAKISYAEIISFFRLKNIKYEVILFEDKFLICSLSDNFDPLFAMANLGGVIKIGKLATRFNILDYADVFKLETLKYIKNNLDTSKKLKIGFSFYKISSKVYSFFVREQMRIKKALSEDKISSRIVISKNKDLSAVIVSKEKLITDSGLDMQVLQSGEDIYCMKTVAIQDFERFGRIDYKRPRIDSQSGMMPPKLAQMMLNLSISRGVVYDPFCGSGTILLMAGELGFSKIIGSDILPRAVSDSNENLAWYENGFNKKLDYEVFESDVLSLPSRISNLEIDCIVSEGYLGKALRGNESFEFIQKQIATLEELYIKTFEVYSKILEEKAIVVMSIPVFVHQTKLLYLDVLEKIEKFGFRLDNLVEEKYLGKRKTLIYKRDDQKVYREIVRLVRLGG